MKLCIYILTLVFCTISSLYGQVRLYGIVTDGYNKGVAHVKVFIEGAYDEGVTDSTGHYSFNTGEKGDHMIVAHLDGFNDVQKTLYINTEDIAINMELGQQLQNLTIVTIKANAAISPATINSAKTLGTIEVLTTATNGDFISALKLLPGAQQVGESGELYVRGGEGNETRLFIDGMLVSNYLRSAAPNQASTSRFSPTLFKEINYNTGNYSAAYGEGLSSALILETNDLPYKSSANVSLSPFFGEADVELLSKNNKSAISASVNYLNFYPYFKIFKPDLQNQNFYTPPQAIETYGRYVLKTKHGYLKFYTTYSTSNLSYVQNQLDSSGKKIRSNISNNNSLSMLTLNEKIGNWKIEAGTSWSYNADVIRNDSTYTDNYLIGSQLKQQEILWQTKLLFRKNITPSLSLNFGGEDQYYTEGFSDSLSKTFKDNLAAAFAEVRYMPAKNLIATAGIRYEYSSLLARRNLAPRMDLLYSFNDKDYVNISYSIFYEKPLNIYLLDTALLNFEKATHYIIAYQKSLQDRLLHAEVYNKKYTQLIKTVPLLGNGGYGYARGFDLLWKDKETLKTWEYWVSYSYLDTRRNYMDYPISAMPMFAASHTASLVLKKYINKLSLITTATYTYASGRPYYNPEKRTSDFMTDRTISYNNLNLNIAYLTKIKSAFTVVMLTLSNVIGNKQVFGYDYAVNNISREAIAPLYKRFLFVGVFVNFGIDRRYELVNENQ